MIAFANRPLFYNPLGWQTGTLIESAASGKKRVELPSGEILSVQPKGAGFAYEARPAGTDGPYEQCIVSGDKLVYQPDDLAVVPFVSGL